MKLQFSVDDAIANQLKADASKLGLSLSSYVRFLVIQTTKPKKKLNAIDVALLENGEETSPEDFKKLLKDLH